MQSEQRILTLVFPSSSQCFPSCVSTVTEDEAIVATDNIPFVFWEKISINLFHLCPLSKNLDLCLCASDVQETLGSNLEVFENKNGTIQPIKPFGQGLNRFHGAENSARLFSMYSTSP